MNKHTQGAWHIAKDARTIESANGQAVSGCVVSRMTNADARLIAAAPELLAVLKRYVAWQEGNFDAIDIDKEILDPAKAAIAKATK